MNSPAEGQTSVIARRHDGGSLLRTLFLIPFLFLPYRFLWLPCALGLFELLCGGRDDRTPGWTLVVGAPLVLLIRTAQDPSWWLPWLVLLAVAFTLRRRLSWNGVRRWPVLALAFLAAGVVLARPDVKLAAQSPAIPANALLVCAGDSLTSGVTPGTDAGTYVACLRKRLLCRVLNAGIANDRAEDLLRRLDKDVLSKKPRCVLLFIGGNDYLDGTPRSRFRDSLDAITGRIAAAGARLVIVEVPTGIVWNPYAGLYRGPAEQHDAILVPDTRLRLWFTAELLARQHLDEPLTIDGIHLSPAGARRVADWLEPYVRAALTGDGTDTAASFPASMADR